MSEETDRSRAFAELTAEVVSAYVSNNFVRPTDLPSLIADISSALRNLNRPVDHESPAMQLPAVTIKKSVTPDYIICLEDGQKFKSMKRHLSNKFGLSPEAYRAKWNLPADYPMVASNYAAARSALAKAMGLGRKPGELRTQAGKKPTARL